MKNQLEILEAKKEEVGKLHQRQVEQLEKISGLSVDQAKSQLVEALKSRSKNGSDVLYQRHHGRGEADCQ